MNVKLATQLLSQSTDEMVFLACAIKACTITLWIYVSIGTTSLTYAMVRMDLTHQITLL